MLTVIPLHFFTPQDSRNAKPATAALEPINEFFAGKFERTHPWTDYHVVNHYDGEHHCIGEHSDADPHWGPLEGGDTVILTYTYEQAAIFIIMPNSDLNVTGQNHYLVDYLVDKQHLQMPNKKSGRVKSILNGSVVNSIMCPPNSVLFMGGFFQGQLTHQTMSHRDIMMIARLVQENNQTQLDKLKNDFNASDVTATSCFLNSPNWRETLQNYFDMQRHTGDFTGRTVFTLRHVVTHDGSTCLTSGKFLNISALTESCFNTQERYPPPMPRVTPLPFNAQSPSVAPQLWPPVGCVPTMTSSVPWRALSDNPVPPFELNTDQFPPLQQLRNRLPQQLSEQNLPPQRVPATQPPHSQSAPTQRKQPVAMQPMPPQQLPPMKSPPTPLPTAPPFKASPQLPTSLPFKAPPQMPPVKAPPPLPTAPPVEALPQLPTTPPVEALPPLQTAPPIITSNNIPSQQQRQQLSPSSSSSFQQQPTTADNGQSRPKPGKRWADIHDTDDEHNTGNSCDGGPNENDEASDAGVPASPDDEHNTGNSCDGVPNENDKASDAVSPDMMDAWLKRGLSLIGKSVLVHTGHCMDDPSSLVNAAVALREDIELHYTSSGRFDLPDLLTGIIQFLSLRTSACEAVVTLASTCIIQQPLCHATLVAGKANHKNGPFRVVMSTTTLCKVLADALTLYLSLHKTALGDAVNTSTTPQDVLKLYFSDIGLCHPWYLLTVDGLKPFPVSRDVTRGHNHYYLQSIELQNPALGMPCTRNQFEVCKHDKWGVRLESFVKSIVAKKQYDFELYSSKQLDVLTSHTIESMGDMPIAVRVLITNHLSMEK